jgi:hypothetical protein
MAAQVRIDRAASVQPGASPMTDEELHTLLDERAENLVGLFVAARALPSPDEIDRWSEDDGSMTRAEIERLADERFEPLNDYRDEMVPLIAAASPPQRDMIVGYLRELFDAIRWADPRASGIREN